MCLIITRDAGAVIPKENFLTACKINPDGWGLSIPDYDGKLVTLKSLETNAEELYDLIHGDFKQDTILLHLRFTTAGETIFRNAHPFPILEKNVDGADVRMAHNGTLYKFKPTANANNKWESDTRVFVREFVRPLFKRLSRGMSSEEILDDPFVEGLLDDNLTGSSVLAFIDGYGNIQHVNAKGNGGEFRDGYWVSNTYSFDPKHREPKSTVVYPRTYGYHSSGWVTDYKPPQPVVKSVPKVEPKKVETERFTEKWDLNEADLYEFDDELIEELVSESEEDTVLLIKELLEIAYKQKEAIKGLNAKLNEREKKNVA